MPVEAELRGLAIACCGSNQTADELFQETSINCWRSFAGYDPARPFLKWSQGVMRRTLANQQRSSSRQPHTLSLDIIDLLVAETADKPASDQRLEKLRHCLQGLSPRLKQSIALRYAEKCGREAIAERMGSTVVAVKKISLWRVAS